MCQFTGNEVAIAYSIVYNTDVTFVRNGDLIPSKLTHDILYLHNYIFLYFTRVALGGLVVSVLATGPKVRGFDPDRGR